MSQSIVETEDVVEATEEAVRDALGTSFEAKEVVVQGRTSGFD